MYLGKFVEFVESNEFYSNFLYLYIQVLFFVILIFDLKIFKERIRIILEGDVLSFLNFLSGCRFRIRCRYVFDRCKEEELVFKDVGFGYYVVCYLMDRK